MTAPEGKPRFAQPFPDYEILERIGSGAMGTVFRARHKKLDRIVAIKVLKPGLSRNARYVDRLVREAQIVARLNHPSIVKGYDLGNEGGYHFFVMEYVGGRSLKDLLREWGRFPEEQALSVGIQIGRALAHAYTHGVIHRDIKPGNILIDENGNAKLTDLGLAKGPEDASLTADGATLGTPHYISPEQARDPSAADIRSDLYSLGATLYHMVTGSPPFQGESIAQVIEKVLYQRVDSASRLNPSLSDGLILVIRKLMAKDPALRYQEPAELIADLELLERSELPSINPRDLEPRPPRRWVLPVSLAAGSVALAAAAFVFWPREPETSVDPTARRVVIERLHTEVARETDPIRKLALLDSFEPAGAAERREHELMRKRVADAFADDVRSFLQELSHGFTDWVKESPRSAGEWLERYVPGRISERYGCTPTALPGGAATEYRSWRDREAELVGRRLEELFRRSEAAYREFLEWKLRPLARQRDFAAALRAMRELDRDFGAESELPLPKEFPGPEFRDRIAALAARRDEIMGEPVRAARLAAAELADDLEGLEKLLESESARRDPRGSLRDLEELREGLRKRHPPAEAFPDAVASPWGKVENRLAQAEMLFRSELRTVERTKATTALDAALGLLRSYDNEAATKVLSRVAASTPEVARELDAWRSLIDALTQAERWLRAIHKVEAAAWRGMDRRDAVRDAEQKDPQGARKHRAGIAFFLFLADELGHARELLDVQSDPDGVLFDRIVVRMEEMKEESGRDDKEIQSEMGKAMGEMVAGRPAGALVIAQKIETRFSARNIYPKYKESVDDLQLEAQRAVQDEAKRSAILSQLPRGAVADVTTAGQVLIRIEASKLVGSEFRPPAGFELAGGSLKSTRKPGDAAALTSPFPLRTCLASDRTATATLVFEVPDGAPLPLLLVSFHGYHAALASPGKGPPLAAVFPGSISSMEPITRALLEALRNEVPADRAPPLVPGGRYKLVLTVDVSSRKKTRVTLRLDDTVIAEGEWNLEQKRNVAELALRPFGPFELKVLELRGEEAP